MDCSDAIEYVMWLPRLRRASGKRSSLKSMECILQRQFRSRQDIAAHQLLGGREFILSQKARKIETTGSPAASPDKAHEERLQGNGDAESNEIVDESSHLEQRR